MFGKYGALFDVTENIALSTVKIDGNIYTAGFNQPDLMDGTAGMKYDFPLFIQTAESI